MRTTERATAESRGAAADARPPASARAGDKPRGLTTKQWLSRQLADAAGRFSVSIPLPIGYWLVDRAGDLFYRFAAGYRASVIDNLRHVRGPDASLDELRALARRAFRYSARNFYDLTRLRYLSMDQIARQVRVIGSWQEVEAAIAQGRGVIFITAHTGAFDFAGQMIPHHGYPAILVTARTVAEFVHDAVTYLRGTKGFDLEEATPGGLRRLMRSLRQGGTVGLATDRDFLRNGMPVRFFGQETTLPVGAVRMAMETGALVVPVICRRHGLHQTFLIEEGFSLARTGKRGASGDADVLRGLEQVVAVLEHHIRADPGQWVMFQRVWPSAPPPAVAVFPVGSPLEGRLLGGETSSLAAEPPPPPP